MAVNKSNITLRVKVESGYTTKADTLTYLEADDNWTELGNAIADLEALVATLPTNASDIGLGNVDNTSDANKPVSTAQQTALDGKLSLSGGTLTGDLILDADPLVALGAATRQFVLNNLPSNNDIEQAYNAEVAQISSGEKNTGTGTSVRRFSPADVRDMILIHAPDSGGGSFAGLTGEVTAGQDGVTTIASKVVDFDNIINLAGNTILGNNTGGVGAINALTTTQVRTMLNVADGAQVNQTINEIDTGLLAIIPQITTPEITAGTETNRRQFSPDDIRQMVLAHETGNVDLSAYMLKTEYAPNNPTAADAFARANHTGTQPVSSLADFRADNRESIGTGAIVGNSISLLLGKSIDVALSGDVTLDGFTGAVDTDTTINFTGGFTVDFSASFKSAGNSIENNEVLEANPRIRVIPKGNGGLFHVKYLSNPIKTFSIQLSDNLSQIEVGTGKGYWRPDKDIELLDIRATLLTAGNANGGITIDMNDDGASVFSTLLTIDQDEKSSATASTPYVFSSTSVASESEITWDIDAIGTDAAGAQVTLYYREV